MWVIATAGHVDHGKSTLVRALTGMEPDRWAEERRRGMTIDLGFAWTRLPSGGTVAFVDVPGHERFVPNMLAGVGPVPAAMLVVAADEGWMPQSAEHLAALAALGAGRLGAGTELELAGSGRAVRVRGLQSLGAPVSTVDAVARVAVNLRGVDREAAGRGDALITPGRYVVTDLIDVRVHGDPVADLPAGVVLHVGSAAVPAWVRPLGTDTARLRLARAAPPPVGRRALLRGPGRHPVPRGVA